MVTPARRLKKSAVKNIVRFPAIKANSGRSILVESILESKYCLLLEFDSEVKEYFPQPKTFAIPLPNSEETISYTPDFEVHFMSGEKAYIEIKPFEIACSGEYQMFFEIFKSYLENTVYSFEVVTEKEILAEPRISNFQKLYRYKSRPFDLQKIYEISSRYSVSPTISFLLKKHSNDVTASDIYAWIAKGYLEFDYCNEALDINAEVNFNV